jgi:hypothetical protein
MTTTTPVMSESSHERDDQTRGTGSYYFVQIPPNVFLLLTARHVVEVEHRVDRALRMCAPDVGL